MRLGVLVMMQASTYTKPRNRFQVAALPVWPDRGEDIYSSR